MTTVPTPVPRSRMPRPVHVVLVIAAVILGITLGLLLAREWGTRWSPTHVVEGSGVAATQSRAVPGFTSVDLAGSSEVVVRVGAKQSVVVTADDNLIDRVTTEVRDGTLVIGSIGSFTTKQPMTLDVTVPSLGGIELTGSGNLSVEGVREEQFTVRVPGSGVVSVRGTTDRLDVGLAGSGDLRLQDLVAHDVEATLSGSGRMHVHATHSLEAELSGSGLILYGGNPDTVTRDVTGSGAVVRA